MTSSSLRGHSASSPATIDGSTSPPGPRKKRAKATAGDGLPPNIFPPEETLAMAIAPAPAAEGLTPPQPVPVASLVPTINNTSTQPPQPPPPPFDGSYTPEALADEIILGLPGLTTPLNFRQFSGYLPITDTKNIFYWYVEAEETPDEAPLVFWTNGGPGCSGLFGLMNENGPFRPTADGKAVHLNPYSWNKVANMLFVEQPVTVGFSYTDNPEDLVFGDDQAALDNYLVILMFLNRYPHMRHRDLYLSGESYGGHYLPFLARFILDKNQEIQASAAAAPSATATAEETAALPPSLALHQSLNLRGFLVGNPSTDPVLQLIGQVDTLHSRHLLPPYLYERWTALCASTPTVPHLGSTACVEVQREVLEAVSEYDVYSMGYPPCPLLAAGEEVTSISSRNRSSSTRSSIEQRSKNTTALTGDKTKRGVEGGMGGGRFNLLGNDEYWAELFEMEQSNSGVVAAPAPAPAPAPAAPIPAPAPASIPAGNRSTAHGPHHHRHLRSPTRRSVLPSLPTSPPLPYESCQALYGATYLNRLDVKGAIHANKWVTWEDCSSLILETFERSDWSLFDFNSLVEGRTEGRREPLRVLLYSGEDDAVCSSKGTELWLETLGWTIADEWAPWSVREGGRKGESEGKAGGAQVVAGMKKKYENGVVYATVNGAGHAVPSFKPREALQLFTDFLEGRL
ncbi:serine carboxypeptidase ii-2 [Nannochloropsis oceanica]